MRARDRLLGLAVLLLLLSLAAAQRAVPASEVEGTLIPPRPALTIEVNDSSGLYDALLQAEGEEGEDLTVLLQNDVDLSDPVWEGGEGITLPPGRTAVISAADLSPERPDVMQVDALTAAGAKALNFSMRPAAIRMESNSTLQLDGIVVEGTARYTAERELNLTYRSGLAVYPSVVSEPDVTVIYSNTYINFWNADCEVSTFNGLTFRLGLALQNASKVGVLDPTTAYILGTTPLEFPLRKLPDLDSTGPAVGLNTAVLDNDVLHCVVGYQPEAPANASSGGGGGSSTGGGGGDDGNDGGGLPAWGWALIGLGIAAILVGALLPLLLHRHRKRRDAAAAKRAGVNSPAGPASLQGLPLDSENGLKDYSEIDMVSLQLMRGVLRSRIGEMHGLSFEEVIGRGGFATGHRGRWRGAYVAIKLIEHSLTSGLAEQVEREAALSCTVSHPNVVPTYKVATVAIQELNQLEPIHDVVGQALPTPEGSSVAAVNASSADSRAGPSSSADDSGPPLGGGGAGQSSSEAYPGRGSEPVVLQAPATAAPAAARLAEGESELCATLIVQEYCDRGSVESAMARRALFWHPDGSPDRVAVVRLLLDVAMGCDYLHAVALLLHLDLKAGNVLLKSVGYNKRGYCGKLSDFGLSRALEGPATSIHTAAVGTAAYMAPEVISEGRLSKAADVYAFSILMWTMWTCTPAFRNVAMPQLSYLVVHERQRLPIPSGMDPRYAALMTRCWEHEPALRPPFEEILTVLKELLADLL